MTRKQDIVLDVTEKLMAKYDFIYAHVTTVLNGPSEYGRIFQTKVVIKKTDVTYSDLGRLIDIEAEKMHPRAMTSSIIKEVKEKIERRVIGNGPPSEIESTEFSKQQEVI